LKNIELNLICREYGIGGFPPEWVYHYYADNVDWTYGWPDGSHAEIKVGAHTQLKLFTGGMAGVGRQNLIELQCGATAYGQPPGGSWEDTPQTNVPYSSLWALGKNVGEDGNLWVVEPDGAALDLNLTAKGYPHYDAGASAAKYKLTITANGNDLSITNPEFCVGQKVTFDGAWDSDPGAASTSYSWALASTFVNRSTQANSYSSVNWDIDPDSLNSAGPFAYWITGGNKNAYLHETLHFSNGQSITVSASGQFSMFRPKAVMSQINIDGTPMNVWRNLWDVFCNNGTIGLGSLPGANDMCFEIQILSPDFSGNAKITQLISEDDSGLPSLDPYLPYYAGVTYLDNSDPYQNAETSVFTNSVSPFNGNLLNIIRLQDAPSVTYGQIIHMEHNYTDYVMFAPSGGIYVPLGQMTWSTLAHVSCGNTNISPNSATGPSNPDNSDNWPTWSNVFSNPN
jgi:hypothetical protein